LAESYIGRRLLSRPEFLPALGKSDTFNTKEPKVYLIAVREIGLADTPKARR
jgi:hypothetical protein